jgi:hypothetical protein
MAVRGRQESGTEMNFVVAALGVAVSLLLLSMASGNFIAWLFAKAKRSGEDAKNDVFAVTDPVDPEAACTVCVTRRDRGADSCGKKLSVFLNDKPIGRLRNGECLLARTTSPHGVLKVVGAGWNDIHTRRQEFEGIAGTTIQFSCSFHYKANVFDVNLDRSN